MITYLSNLSFTFDRQWAELVCCRGPLRPPVFASLGKARGNDAPCSLPAPQALNMAWRRVGRDRFDPFGAGRCFCWDDQGRGIHPWVMILFAFEEVGCGFVALHALNFVERRDFGQQECYFTCGDFSRSARVARTTRPTMVKLRGLQWATVSLAVCQ